MPDDVRPLNDVRQAGDSEGGLLVEFKGQDFFTCSRAASTPAPVQWQRRSSSHSATSPTSTSASSSNSVPNRTQIVPPSLLAHLRTFPTSPKRVIITELRLDDSPSSPSSSNRLAVFYSSPDDARWHAFALIRFVPSSSTCQALDWSEELFTIRSGPEGSVSRIALCRFYSPMMVTCDTEFEVAFWVVRPADGAPFGGETVKGMGKEKGKERHMEAARWRLDKVGPSFRSEFCWWPVVLSLSPLRSHLNPTSSAPTTERPIRPLPRRRQPVQQPNAKEEQPRQGYVATLAYSTPFYPDAFTIGVQEFRISLPIPSSPTTTASSSSAQSPTANLVRIRTRHATASPLSDPTHKRPRLSSTSESQERDERTCAPSIVTGLQHSGRWVCAARSDNTVEVFEIVNLPSSRSPTGSRKRKPDGARDGDGEMMVLHRRTLWGHTGSVQALAVRSEPELDSSQTSSDPQDGESTSDFSPEASMTNSITSGRGRGKCISAAADGEVKIWDLWSGGGRIKEEVTLRSPAPDLVGTANGEDSDEQVEVEETKSLARWLKSSPDRSTSTPTKGKGRGRISWLGFDEDKIACVTEVGSAEGEGMYVREQQEEGREGVRVFSFD